MALLNFILISPLFSQISFTSSNLPIVVIDTHGQTILDDPKIVADMGIIWDASGKRNALSDPKNNYNGKIGIEIRGSSSQMFPKKSYGFETRSDAVNSVDVSLLGMPAENDWILYGPYSDKTLIRNVLTFTLDAGLGHYSPRCRFVELFLNSNYQGVYVLMEKIKRNKSRVDIAKLKDTDNSGEDLTGGYIIKIDKTTGSGGDGWYSNYYNANGRTYYQYDYPKQEDITAAQKTYIQNYVRSTETVLYQGKYSGAGSYHEYLNDSSFIDYMIITELSKNVDGYRLSTFLYKDKNGLLNCGPIWDYNLAYGNADYYNGGSTYGFQYQADLGSDYWQNPFWWKKLVNDPAYSSKLKKRWAGLRQGPLSDKRINFVADSLVDLLSEAEARNFQQWPVIGTYVWPNFYIGSTYAAEVSWMKTWIKNRLSYLDQSWPYIFDEVNDVLAETQFSVFPNPFSDRLSVEISSGISGTGTAEFFNGSGALVRTAPVDLQNGRCALDLSGANSLNAGFYFLKIVCNRKVILTQKVVKIG